ncbi:MAG: OmpA family protein [Methylocapsa sp.]|nr:OmpA family protein [Methylocapsa sp.]
MTVAFSKFFRVLAYSPLALGLALANSGGPARAEEGPSVQQIIEALKPKQDMAPGQERTRSLDLGPPSLSAPGSNQEAQFIDTLRNRPTRSITLGEREGLGKFTPGRPAIDFEINFDFGSAKIGRSAAPVAAHLGEALASPDLKGSTFIIEGHTDGKGKDLSNQRLSERRADAVRRYLVTRYDIPRANLIAVGYGKSQLKNPGDPYAAENRRVRVINMGTRLATR